MQQHVGVAAAGVFAVIGMGLGCKGTGAAPVSCDPLAASEEPIELGEVLAVGRDSAGTLYVVDVAGGGETRLFVSDGGMLFRRRLAGSGGGRGPDGEFYVLSVNDDETPFELIVEVAPSGETAMGIATGEDRDVAIADIGDQGEVLEVVGEAEIADTPLRNLPGEVEVEYVAEVEGDKVLVVVRPRDDWSYDDFELFYGAPDRLVQREVREVTRQLDGGSTTIRFVLDSAEAQVEFPVVSAEADGEPTFEAGPATLRVGADELDIRLIPDMDRDVSSLGFLCIAD